MQKGRRLNNSSNTRDSRVVESTDNAALRLTCDLRHTRTVDFSNAESDDGGQDLLVGQIEIASHAWVDDGRQRLLESGISLFLISTAHVISPKVTRVSQRRYDSSTVLEYR